jgi:DNA-binding NarL/FixJ family response regulator
LYSKSVLIVDDNKSFLESAIKFLTTDDHFSVVGWAFSASEAFDKISKYSPDLVLLDFKLPDMNGFDATKKIKSLPNPPLVVIVSFNNSEIYLSEAVIAGADGYLSKSEFGENIISLMESLFPSKAELNKN